jgi:hypothetical protein
MVSSPVGNRRLRRKSIFCGTVEVGGHVVVDAKPAGTAISGIGVALDSVAQVRLLFNSSVFLLNLRDYKTVHHAPAGNDRFTVGQPHQDQLRPVLDPVVELNQRHVLHGRRVHSVRDVGLGCRLPFGDDILLGHLLRPRRLRNRAGHGDGRHDQHLSRKEM